MEYTQIPKEVKNEIEKICQPTNEVNVKLAKEDITYFAFHQLGIKPYQIQYILFKEIESERKKIILCKSRQVGMSFGIGIACLWAAIYNKFPSAPYNNTKICIVSQDDEAAKKLIAEIRSLISKGDYWMFTLTGGRVNNYFSCQIDEKDRNNMSMISLKNKCWIKSFPPTKAIRGNSANITIVDEAAFVDEEVYTEAILPTISHTDGKMILSSTPKGTHGLFYNIFDPDDLLPEHDFKRLWFYWKHCEDEVQLINIQKEIKTAELRGDVKSVDQEFNALFTADKSSFLNPDKVNASVDKELTQVYEFKEPCIIGIDYGMTNCHTVLTIVTKKEDKLILLYQYSFPLSSDDADIPVMLRDLQKRFSITKAVVDDCPQGYRTNQELEGFGIEIEKFNFRSDAASAERNRGYFIFRSAIHQGKVRIPPIIELVSELKNLQEETLQVTTKICKPKGGFDDRADSFMLACYPYLKEESGTVYSEAVGMDEEELIRINPKVDLEWMRLCMMEEKNEIERKKEKEQH